MVKSTSIIILSNDIIRKVYDLFRQQIEIGKKIKNNKRSSIKLKDIRDCHELEADGYIISARIPDETSSSDDVLSTVSYD